MKNVFKILILLLIFPTIICGQENQVIKGRSVTKRLEYKNANEVKIKKVNSDIKIDSLVLIDINRNNILDFGEEGIIKCIISNRSINTLEDLNLNIILDKGLNKIIFPTKSKIERIDPRSILELSIPIKNVNNRTPIPNNAEVNLRAGVLPIIGPKRRSINAETTKCKEGFSINGTPPRCGIIRLPVFAISRDIAATLGSSGVQRS